MSKILYFDTISGISGDMASGALIDLLTEKELALYKEQLKKLNMYTEFSVEINKKSKNGIFGTKFDVVTDETHSHSRNLNDITDIIDNASLSDNVKNLAKEMFAVIAAAEAKVHNKGVDEIHFHEVGAVDSIVDIISVCILIEILNIDDIRAERVQVGTGFTKCEHGIIPVPAPATLEILKGIPTYSNGIEAELVTPTGASIIRALVKKFEKRPVMNIEKIGYGLGTKDLEIPNVLRVMIAEIDSTNVEELVLLETNIDDMSSEIFSYLFETLFSVGALDVYTSSVGMKKNRPGTVLSVLVNHEIVTAVEEILFRETSTFGIRKRIIERVSLKRKMERVSTSFGEVKVKIGYFNGEIIKVTPEYEDVKNIAVMSCVPFFKVYNETIAKIQEQVEWN